MYYTCGYRSRNSDHRQRIRDSACDEGLIGRCEAAVPMTQQYVHLGVELLIARAGDDVELAVLVRSRLNVPSPLPNRTLTDADRRGSLARDDRVDIADPVEICCRNDTMMMPIASTESRTGVRFRGIEPTSFPVVGCPGWPRLYNECTFETSEAKWSLFTASRTATR
jgi:hypothetical protein